MTDKAPAVKSEQLQFDDESLAKLESIEDIQNLAGQSFSDAADLGSGFALLENKDRLIGVPCIFVSWRTNRGDYGDFVSANVVTHDDNGRITGKFVINDGSTGLAQQLATSGLQAPLRAKHGLRRSDYEYDGPDGPVPASTYYIDTSA